MALPESRAMTRTMTSVYFGKSVWAVAQVDQHSPQTHDSADMVEAFSHADGALEWASISPAPASTVNAAGAGWQGAASYFPFN